MESKAAGNLVDEGYRQQKRHKVVNVWLNVILKFSTDSYVDLFCRNSGFIHYFNIERIEKI